MEGALKVIRPDRFQFLILAGIGAFAFLLGFFFDAITLRFWILGIFGILALGFFALPYRWAIWLLFFYLSFEGMLKILTNYNPAVHVGADILVCALTFRWFLTFLIMRESLPQYKPPLLVLFGAHFVWFLIEFFNPYALGVVPSLAGMKVYVTMVLLYGYGYYLATSPKEVGWYCLAWVWGAVLQTVTGLYQAALGPVSVLALSPNYARPLEKYAGLAFRPFGTSAVSGGASVIIALAAPFIIYTLFQTRSVLYRALLLILMPAALTTVFLCQVRVALLKTLVGVSSFLFLGSTRASKETRKKILMLAPVAVLIMIFAIPRLTSHWSEEQTSNAAAFERTMSLFDYERIKGARAGAGERIIRYAKQVPLGAGFSRAGAAAGAFWSYNQSDPYFPNGFFGDNFWAASIAEVGIPGSLIMTLIIFSILYRGMKNLSRFKNADLATLNAALWSALIMIAIGLWGSEGLLYNPEAAYFWFFSGALMRLPDLDL